MHSFERNDEKKPWQNDVPTFSTGTFKIFLEQLNVNVNVSLGFMDLFSLS